MDKVYLIDSMAYIFRSFYAIRQMNSSDGTPTNALFGFIKSIEKIIKDFQPEQIIAVFDAGEKTFRNDIYPDYKANRSECPEELRPQFDLIKKYLNLRGIPIVIKKGYEADDLIGTLALESEKLGIESYICTGDKDLMQLVNEKTFICQTHKDNLILDKEKVKELMGVYPSQIIDYLSIMGDSSDNIPGLPGIGAKGAAQLLQEFDNLETILNSAEKIKGKRKIEAITNHSELAFLSKKLVTLDCNVELDKPLQEITNTPPQWEELEQFYQHFQMNALVRDLSKIQTLSKKPQTSLKGLLKDKSKTFKIYFTTIAPVAFQNELISLKVLCDDYEFNLLNDTEEKDITTAIQKYKNLFKNNQCKFVSNNIEINSEKLESFQSLNFDFLLICWLFDVDIIYKIISNNYPHIDLICQPLIEQADFNQILKEGVDTIKNKSKKYKIIQTKGQLNSLFEKIKSVDEICLDTETTSLKAFETELLGIGISFKADEAYYIPFNDNLESKYLIEQFSDLLAQPNLKVFGQNIKYDYEVLSNYEIDIKNISFDTLIASYIANPSSNFHNLDHQALHYLNYQKIATKELLKAGKKKRAMSEIPLQEIANYCCEDVDYTWQLKQILTKELKNKHSEELFYQMEIPLIKVLARMEKNGIAIDTKVLQAMSKEFTEKISELEKSIFDLAGENFNISSPKQLGEILFTKLQLPHWKKTKSGYSTDISILEKLKNSHPIAQKLIEFRMLTKLKSTYIDTLPNEINPTTQRIHSSFSQSTAATGRLASSNPNLQNIPTRTKEGKLIRSAFIPQQDCVFLSCDYSQIELRIMAILSKDENLIKAFQQDIDIHTFTASLIFNTPLEKVTKEQRYNAKAVNFGIIYGQSAFGLANNLNIPVSEAKKFIKEYFTRYPKVQQFMSQSIAFVNEHSYSKTIFERRRYIPEIYHTKATQKNFGERIAINSPIQGSAADLIKKAMLDIDSFLQRKKLKSKMILQIHDELIFEVYNDELELMKENIPTIMENCHQTIIPFKVDTAVASNWSECD